MTARVWAGFGYGYALLVSAVLSYFLLGLPVQLTDSFLVLLNLQDQSLWTVLYNEFWQPSFLRPFFWTGVKLVLDAAGTDYFWWFRGLHALQVSALILLFVAVVRPRGWQGAAVLPLGLAVLVGLHTFAGLVREAYPINHYLTVVLCCFAAAVLALSSYRWWNDVLAAGLLVFAALTIESGLLVPVVFFAAALTGARGVSRAGLAAQGVLLAGYFVLRFAVLDVGGPALFERESNVGFSRLNPGDLVERFGDNPAPFYAYNVVTSAVSVVLSEPRAGEWRLIRGFVIGAPEPAMLVNVFASVCALGLLARFLWRRRRAWRSRRFTRDDQVVSMFLATLAANAVLSYPYTKDAIMAPAGAFLAAAVFVSARDWLQSIDGSATLRRTVVTAVFCLIMSTTWVIRATGIHVELREMAFKVRNQWAYADEWLVEQGVGTMETPAAAALKQRLQEDAVWRHPAPPPLLPPADWTAVFDVN